MQIKNFRTSYETFPAFDNLRSKENYPIRSDYDHLN